MKLSERMAMPLGITAVGLALASYVSLLGTGQVHASRAQLVPRAGGVGGGVSVAPAFVSADRTPFAVSASVRGLRGGAVYSVKVRLNSASRGQFGSTWNSSTRRWCSASAAWSTQSTVTAGPDGVFAGWLTARAGSKSTSATEGTASIAVVLRAEGSVSNLEAPVEAPTSVRRPEAGRGIGWLHGRFSMVARSTAPHYVLARDGTQAIVGSALVEPNLVDDDDNGVVDDERWLAEGGSAQFRVVVPTGRLISLRSPNLGGLVNQVAFDGLDLGVPRSGTTRRVGLVARPRTGVWYRRLTIEATLSGSAPETVSIERSTDGTKWVGITSGRTDARGVRTVSVRRCGNSAYRAVWLGNPDCPASVSRAVRVTTTPIVTARVRPTRLRVGASVLISGRFSPGSVRRRLVIALVDARTRKPALWRTVVVGSGVFGCRLRPRRAGKFAAIVRFGGDRSLAARAIRAGTVTVSP